MDNNRRRQFVNGDIRDRHPGFQLFDKHLRFLLRRDLQNAQMSIVPALA